MRKTGMLFVGLLLLLGLIACSNSKETDGDGGTASKGETIEVAIEDASYILSGNDEGKSIEDEPEGGLLQIYLNIKNVSDSSINIYPDMQMQLYDGETQIDPTTEINVLLDMDTDLNNTIGAGKQKTMSVLFNVEKDTEYEINISPMSSDFEAEVEDTIVPIDTSEYNDSLEALHDPEKALIAYIETIYFDKDNSDYDKFVSADKSSLQDDGEKQFAKGLEMSFSNDISDNDVEKYYESFKQASAEKDEIEAEVIGNANDKAIVKLNYTALSLDDMSSEVRKYKEEYRDKNDGFNPEKEDEYALSKFDSILDKLDAKSGSRELEIHMKRNEDGKWSIDDSRMDVSKDISRVFAEGVVM